MDISFRGALRTFMEHRGFDRAVTYPKNGEVTVLLYTNEMTAAMIKLLSARAYDPDSAFTHFDNAILRETICRGYPAGEERKNPPSKEECIDILDFDDDVN